ncbi:MAG: twin-arginine translocase TatA/TatE family subunit [Microbacteriaceae bacterium]|nr:twin-arginine translocase TatA/TatE family subunit [Microbacteriaceae bacterium]
MGISFEKLMLIMLLAIILIGPDKLPAYAQKLAQLVRSLRQMSQSAKERMREEMGEDFSEEEWRKLDPRQYMPSNIVRNALAEDRAAERRATGAARAAALPRVAQSAAGGGVEIAASASAGAAAELARLRGGAGAPFDSEAT